jgi:hypothetical protein
MGGWGAGSSESLRHCGFEGCVDGACELPSVLGCSRLAGLGCLERASCVVWSDACVSVRMCARSSQTMADDKDVDAAFSSKEALANF